MQARAQQHSLPFKGRVGEGMGDALQGQTEKSILQSRLQRRLRRDMTDAERRIWRYLRGRQLNGFKFRRQHPFGKYILDFVSLDGKLVIEVDGGQHAEGAKQDLIRTQVLEHAGFRVLRFWNNQVLQDIESVKAEIWKTLGAPPPSLPSP